MRPALLGTLVIAIALVPGAPRLHAAAPKTPAAPAAPAPPPDRVVILSADDAAYGALAIPRSYKTAPKAQTRLLVFREGLCIRDIGLADTQKNDEHGTPTTAIVEETGTTERAYVAPDAREAVVVRTRYDSQVDVTPGQKSTANDTVTSDTLLVMVDPAHPDGRWKLTLENGRWAKDVLVLPEGKGVALTTFLPRNGPTDVRVLDQAGHEALRVPERSAQTLRIEASPDGGFVAADVSFRDDPHFPERGVIVFDVAHGSQWTYGWRYGTEAEPLSWKLLVKGVLSVQLPAGARRFDATGRRL